jgi:ElaB/YqjD/DUF883 family membrane-anchored ribosome-binding protein
MNAQLKTNDKDKLVTDMHAVLADAEELMGATASQGGEKVAAIRAKMTARLADAKDKLQDVERDVLEKAKAAAKATDAYVQGNPWQSVLIAGGVGFALGFIVHRLATGSKS